MKNAYSKAASSSNSEYTVLAFKGENRSKAPFSVTRSVHTYPAFSRPVNGRI